MSFLGCKQPRGMPPLNELLNKLAMCSIPEIVWKASQAEVAQPLAYDLGSPATCSKHGEDACSAAHIQHRCTLDQGGVALKRPLICIRSHLLKRTPIKIPQEYLY